MEVICRMVRVQLTVDSACACRPAGMHTCMHKQARSARLSSKAWHCFQTQALHSRSSIKRGWSLSSQSARHLQVNACGVRCHCRTQYPCKSLGSYPEHFNKQSCRLLSRSSRWHCLSNYLRLQCHFASLRSAKHSKLDASRRLVNLGAIPIYGLGIADSMSIAWVWVCWYSK